MARALIPPAASLDGEAGHGFLSLALAPMKGPCELPPSPGDGVASDVDSYPYAFPRRPIAPRILHGSRTVSGAP